MNSYRNDKPQRDRCQYSGTEYGVPRRFRNPGAIIAICYRDADGNLIGGDLHFTDSIGANETIPFQTLPLPDFATEDYELYANIW